MIRLNIGVPVLREPFSFGGWNDSKFGVGDIKWQKFNRILDEIKKINSEMESGGRCKLGELISD